VTDVAFLREALDALVSVPSSSGSEAAITSAFAALCRDAGLEPTLGPVPGRADNVVASKTRGAGPTILLNGHLDTLPVPATGWTRDPYRPAVIGDRYHGAEVNNMKAALAAMLAAVRGMDARQWAGTITLMGVVGECDTLGIGTTTALRAGVHGDAAINGEPTDLSVLLRHAGVIQLRIAATGRSAHVSQRSQGHNAIDDLARALASLDESVLTFLADDRYPGLPTLNVGAIGGGGLPSMLADDAWADVDVRTVPGMTAESVRADMALFLGSVGPAAYPMRVELRSAPAFMNPPAFLADPGSAVVQAVAAAHLAIVGQEVRMAAERPQVFFGSDASHLAASGIPTCIYGPGRAEDINVPDESIEWADVVTAAAVYEEALARLLGVGRG
jgi:acetylornithine deacetylase